MTALSSPTPAGPSRGGSPSRGVPQNDRLAACCPANTRDIPADGAPIDRNSAGKKKGASTGKGNPWLGATIGEIVSAAARTDTFLAERYQRIARRRGKRRAIVAVGNSVLTIIWPLLSDPAASYHDLGPGYYESRINTSAASAPSSASSNSSPARKSPSSPPPDPASNRTGHHHSRSLPRHYSPFSSQSDVTSQGCLAS